MSEPTIMNILIVQWYNAPDDIHRMEVEMELTLCGWVWEIYSDENEKLHIRVINPRWN